MKDNEHFGANLDQAMKITQIEMDEGIGLIGLDQTTGITYDEVNNQWVRRTPALVTEPPIEPPVPVPHPFPTLKFFEDGWRGRFMWTRAMLETPEGNVIGLPYRGRTRKDNEWDDYVGMEIEGDKADNRIFERGGYIGSLKTSTGLQVACSSNPQAASGLAFYEDGDFTWDSQCWPQSRSIAEGPNGDLYAITYTRDPKISKIDPTTKAFSNLPYERGPISSRIPHWGAVGFKYKSGQRGCFVLPWQGEKTGVIFPRSASMVGAAELPEIISGGRLNKFSHGVDTHTDWVACIPREVDYVLMINKETYEQVEVPLPPGLLKLLGDMPRSFGCFVEPGSGLVGNCPFGSGIYWRFNVEDRTFDWKDYSKQFEASGAKYGGTGVSSEALVIDNRVYLGPGEGAAGYFDFTP
tara:strand:+ start:15889 stop:17115 length:1227 start_codon:yes stop_codon:yes gene_type:complete